MFSVTLQFLRVQNHKHDSDTPSGCYMTSVNLCEVTGTCWSPFRTQMSTCPFRLTAELRKGVQFLGDACFVGRAWLVLIWNTGRASVFFSVLNVVCNVMYYSGENRWLFECRLTCFSREPPYSHTRQNSATSKNTNQTRSRSHLKTFISGNFRPGHIWLTRPARLALHLANLSRNALREGLR